MMVAFFACALRLEAPWVCALAIAIDPTTKTAAAKVMVIFRIGNPPSGCVWVGWRQRPSENVVADVPAIAGPKTIGPVRHETPLLSS
jgi:hypothetical protein